MKQFIIRNYGVSVQKYFRGMNVTLARDCIIETDDADMANAMKGLQNIEVTDRGVDVHENVPKEVGKPFNHEGQKPTASLAEQPDAPVDVNEEDENKLPDIPEVNNTDEEISYEDMTKKELVELAKDRDINIKGMSKTEILKALNDFDGAGRPRIEESRKN